jgi:hypothetical protein
MSLRPGLLWLTLHPALFIQRLSRNNTYVNIWILHNPSHVFGYPLGCRHEPLGVRVLHVEDHCPKLPNVALALRTDLRVQFVCQPLYSLQRQTCTYSTGTEVICYFAFKLATETGREIKKRTLAQLNTPPPPFLSQLATRNSATC